MSLLSADFALRNLDGTPQRLIGAAPTGHTVLVFAKADCPTCDFTAPFLERWYRALHPAGLRMVAVFQGDEKATAAFTQRHGLTFPVLIDADLAASLAYAVEIVPTVILVDGAGRPLQSSAGFCRDELREMAALTARAAGQPPPDPFAGADVPALRPGCASLTLDPAFERGRREAQLRERLRSRRITVGDEDDVSEFLFDAGVTDGLPVVPPTESRVARMLEGTRRAPDEVVALVPPNYAPCTVEKVAINAVMAGCQAEYLPVVLAAVEAACTEAFNMHGVLATTYFAAPLIIVNGPIRKRIGMNAGVNVFGQGNRANASIGRALGLVVRNVGGGRPGEVDQATLGQPGKYTYCIAENEEANPWTPLHVERGFTREDSTVTLFAAEAPRAIVDQMSRTARGVVTTIGKCMESVSNHKWYRYPEVVLVLCPEHVETIARDGWSKAEIRARIQEASARPLRELLADDEVGEGIPRRFVGDHPDPDLLARLVPKFASDDSIQIVVAGGRAGKFSAVIGGWVGGSMGSQMVTQKIEEA